jgi:hypothetical protein
MHCGVCGVIWGTSTDLMGDLTCSTTHLTQVSLGHSALLHNYIWSAQSGYKYTVDLPGTWADISPVNRRLQLWLLTRKNTRRIRLSMSQTTLPTMRSLRKPKAATSVVFMAQGLYLGTCTSWVALNAQLTSTPRLCSPSKHHHHHQRRPRSGS